MRLRGPEYFHQDRQPRLDDGPCLVAPGNRTINWDRRLRSRRRVVLPEISNPQRWERIKSLFNDALELPVEHRSAFLAICCEDDELRAEVEAILEHSQRAGSFLRKALPGASRGLSGKAGDG